MSQEPFSVTIIVEVKDEPKEEFPKLTPLGTDLFRLGFLLTLVFLLGSCYWMLGEVGCVPSFDRLSHSLEGGPSSPSAPKAPRFR